MIWKNRWQLLLFALVVVVAGCSRERSLTVTEVIQNAESLNGKTIHVRGFAYLWIDPSQAEMWGSGGCIPKTDPSYRQGVVAGWLTLYDSIYEDNWGGDDAPRDAIGVKISESSFDCNGDYCRLTCSPFEVVAQRMYEFVGTLKVNEKSEFILENIDLDRSRQLVEGKWLSIQNGDFVIPFP